MTTGNEEGNGKSRIIRIPERLVIVPVKTLPFPGNRVTIGMSESFFERVKECGCFVATPFSPLEKKVSSIGVLAMLENGAGKNFDEERGIQSVFLYRVEICDVKRLTRVDEPAIYDCAWTEFKTEEISEGNWASPEVQLLVARLKRALMLASIVLHGFLLNSMGSTEQAVRLDFKNQRLELEDLLSKLWVMSRTNTSLLIDKLAGRIAEFFVFIMPEPMGLAVIQNMRPIFFSEKVEERLGFMVEYFEQLDFSQQADSEGKESDDSSLPDNVREKIEELSRQVDQSAEGQNIATYIAWLRSLPRNSPTKDEEDISKVRKILEEDHYGLDKVKESILEFLAVRKIQPNAKGQILCIVGPPGVGKTSLGVSIARATGRKFVRRSLAGIKDEAALRGHRRTYIGAYPGLIIGGLREAKSNDPVFMLDQVDLLGEHGRDVPEDALIEILDPEQNDKFIDHYLDVPFDISKVFFVCTANTIDGIKDALRNRMKIIEVPGYSEGEKAIIARRYTIPKKLKDFGIEPENLKAKNLPPFTVDLTDKALGVVIGDYVHDAGMRETERAIEDILAKVLLKVSEGKFEELLSNGDPENGKNGNVAAADPKIKVIKITPARVKKYLGKIKERSYFPDLGNPKPGVAFGLAVSTIGQGCILPIEVSTRKSNRLDIKATGHLSTIMEESADVALSRLLHHGGVLENRSHKVFIHLHADDGATPKDGPSAGVVIYAAIYSDMIRKPVKPYFAATGELTKQRDVVSAIGGIKAKLLAARKVGVREVVVPLDNRDDLDELPWKDARIITPDDLIKEGKSWKDFSREPKAEGSFTIYCVEKPEDVLELAFPDDYPPPKEVLERE